MNDSIISNEITEEIGLNTSSVKDIESNINNETGVVTQDDNKLEFSENSIITDEYFDQVCNDMEKMNYIEIAKFNKELKTEKDQLVSAKETANNIIDMKKSLKSYEGDITSAIDEANAEFETGVSDMQEFIDHYDDTMDKMNKLIEKSEEYLHKFDDVKKTTSFLNDAMLQVINKNIKKMETNNKVTKNLRIYYSELSVIFSNRTSIDFVLSKIPDKKSYIRRLKNEMRKETGDQYVKSIQKNVTSVFCSVFSVNQMQTFENYLKDLFNIDGDTETVFYFQYILYLIYNSEKTNGKYGKHKWVETMIMNVLDIVEGNYDLEGGKEFYDSQLLKLREAVLNIL